MIMGEEELHRDQVSVSWEGAAPVKDDPSLQRAAAFAAVLAKTLGNAGYQARRLSVGVSRETPGGVLRLTVIGDVPGLSGPDFEALARATMNGVSARLGYSFEDDLVLVAKLEWPRLVVPLPEPPPPAIAEPVKEPEPAKPAKRRDWFFIGRLAVGLLLGLLLGVLGLPRFQPSLPSFPTAAPRVTPTTASQEVATTSPGEAPTPQQLVISVPTLPITPVVSPTVPPTIVPTVLVNERFAVPPPGWPNDPNGTAWFAGGEFRLFARDTGRFVSVGVPLPAALRTVQITGQFHKIEGPTGGGYGFIIRDQGATSDRDGRNQAGQYLVVEVDDRGDVGIWQRDHTHWIDVIPWTHSNYVRVDRGSNILRVSTDGARLRFDVNGSQVADMTYDRLPPTGGVGIFAGGDLNLVALQWLRIETT